MRRSVEDSPEYDPGPFQPEEGKEIADSVEQFLGNQLELHPDQSYAEDYYPSNAPPGLARRFLLSKPTEGDDESWIPWEEFADELYRRVSAADECKRQLYQGHIQRQAMKNNLTVDQVREIYARELSHGSPAVFDLSDVYVCLEADVLRAYENRDHPDPRKLISNPDPFSTEEAIAIARRAYQASADWSRAVLDIVGQAIGADTR